MGCLCSASAIRAPSSRTAFFLITARIKRGGLLPGGQGAGGIAPRFQFDSSGFELLQGFLAVHQKGHREQKGVGPAHVVIIIWPRCCRTRARIPAASEGCLCHGSSLAET